jgi:Zn-dependent M28 family amino/carboxypeptidase
MRGRIILVILIVISLISSIAIIFFANRIRNLDIDLKFEEKNAYNNVKDQLNIGYRIPGTEESNETVFYFIQRFQEIDPNIAYLIHNFEVESTDCKNVLFKINEKKEKIVILGAHYDSRAKATKESDKSKKPVPGANDGASGCAVLIELANVLFQEKDILSCQLWFVFFDAEDQGKDEGGYGMDGWDWCEGSNEFVDDIDNFYDSGDEEFDCMILLDMVGGDSLQFIKEQYSTSSLIDELFEIGRQLGYTDEFPFFPQYATVIDDHVPFLENNIPSADLIINFQDNPSWPHHHTTDDNLDHISKKSLKITGRTIEQFIFNNYLDKSRKIYNGNKPWDFDVINAEMIILICLFSAGIVGLIVLIYLYKLKKKIE